MRLNRVIASIQHRLLLRMPWSIRADFIGEKGKKSADSVGLEELAAVQRALNLVDNKDCTFVDIAASDGVSQSFIWHLLNSGQLTGGLCVEMDNAKFAVLSYLYQRFPSVALAKIRITPSNVGETLSAFGVAEKYGILNLDIDSYDLEVLRCLLRSGFTPVVISMEITEKIPWPLDFEVLYDPDHTWTGDHFYGCSLHAAWAALQAVNYWLVEVEGNNAIFVSRENLPKDFVEVPPGRLYDSGYRQRKDRLVTFFYNSNVDHWLDLAPREAAKQIREHFSDHDGRYSLSMDFDNTN